MTSTILVDASSCNMNDTGRGGITPQKGSKAMARISMIIGKAENNKHITGNTQRITTDYVAGWCGVDLVEDVTFDFNTAGTLKVVVGERKYKLNGVKKSELYETLGSFLTQTDKQMAEHLVK